MKPTCTLAVVLAPLLLALSTVATPVQGGHFFSHLFSPRGNDPNHQLHHHNQQQQQQQYHHPNNPVGGQNPASIPHLEWNSQIGHQQQSRQGGERNQFEFNANLGLQDNTPGQQLGLDHTSTPEVMAAPCRRENLVYLPDMQSFLIAAPLTHPEALQACIDCRSELVLVDGTNVDRFAEAFRSLGIYADQTLWIKSWFGQQVRGQGSCPAAYVNSLMGSRLEPVEDGCDTRHLALCY
ncbi:hypothetical protein BG011_001882 [Mortierella polycephala]|uniref:Uncharacterized protein n=1 Tax=Mortierella polycephala TaxID=41804 RepID=A0A9P6Q690_9FUNG|nr:hypothetical protein BG011_001882 [Mortierella polycephala]